MHIATPVVGERPFAWEKSYPAGIRWDGVPHNCSLGDYLDRSVRHYASRTALVYEDTTLTYEELGDYVLRVAHAVLHMPNAETGVAILLPNTAYHTIMLFGVASAGRMVVQLSPLDSPRELAGKLRDAGARILVTLADSDLVGKAISLRSQGLLNTLIILDDARWRGARSTMPLPEGALSFDDLIGSGRLDAPVRVMADQPAILQYTGGTTGVPKGAILSHGNVTAAAQMSAYWQSERAKDLEEPDRVIIVLPLFHAFALTVMNRHLGSGNSVLLRRRFDCDQFLDDIEQFCATTVNCVPTMWIAIGNRTDLGQRQLSSISLATSGGAPLPTNIQKQLEQRVGLRIFQGWGMTEAAAIGTQHVPMGEIRPGSIGLPLPSFELQVVSLENPAQILTPNQTGEIRIRGPNVFRGYWNRAEETRTAFVDGFFLTGDVGHMDEDGYVYITDRKKDMIISSGYNVYPRVIEEAIYEHPSVSECVVVGISDEYRGQAAKAFVALKPGSPLFDLDELREFLKTRVGRHEMPTALEVRDRLPRTPVGKLTKLGLVAQ